MAKVYHLVLLRQRPEAEDRILSELLAKLRVLQTKIAGMETVAGGAYSSPEGLNRGFTHALVMTFRDAPTRDAYLAHPDHERIKDEFLPYFEDVIAFDFVE